MTLNSIRIRPLTIMDLNDIHNLSLEAKPGLTSLSTDKSKLNEMILHSESSFSKSINSPHDEFYFFGCEDITLKKIIGTAGIFSQVGVCTPFYGYRVEVEEKKSTILSHSQLVTRLHPETIFYGPSEIGTLFLSENYRKSGIGRLLSLSRFLFMKDQPFRFKDTVIAEMRGVSSEAGISPFWNSVGKRFFKIPFIEADRLSGKDKTFIAELLPKFPIYTNFLSKKACSIIGKTHPSTRGALRLLESQGFLQTNIVDIFDAGPKISASTNTLDAVKNSRKYTISSIKSTLNNNRKYILSSTHNHFTSVLQSCQFINAHSIVISSHSAKLLNVSVDDDIYVYNPFGETYE